MTRRGFFVGLFSRRAWREVAVRTDGTRWQVYWVEGRQVTVVDCPGIGSAMQVARNHLIRSRA